MPGVFLCTFSLSLLDGTSRALCCTGTALYALVCVDFILAIAFADSSDRANASASAAANTTVVDYICHDNNPPFTAKTYLIAIGYIV
jgi:hypothetical protein